MFRCLEITVKIIAVLFVLGAVLLLINYIAGNSGVGILEDSTSRKHLYLSVLLLVGAFHITQDLARFGPGSYKRFKKVEKMILAGEIESIEDEKDFKILKSIVLNN